MAGSVVCCSSSGEVGSEGAKPAEDSVDSVCGFKGASDVEEKSAKKQTEAAGRGKTKERGTDREDREMEKEVVVVGCL